jgi:NAD(P)H dehydrogenase (quinone)
MSVMVVLAHPARESFNHAIANSVSMALRKAGYEINFHDLYEEKFPPVMPGQEIHRNADLPGLVEQHCREIAAAEGIIIVHPNWWGQPPAILKGWIDRVIRPGVAYEFREGDKGEGVPAGLLKARAAMVFNTSNTMGEREIRVFGDPLETIWKNCIFGLCGVENFYRKNFSVIVTSTPEQRKEWLKEVENIVERYFPKVG